MSSCPVLVDSSYDFAGSLALSADGSTIFSFFPIVAGSFPTGSAVISAAWPDGAGLTTLAGNGTTDSYFSLCALDSDLFWLDGFDYIRTVPQAGGSNVILTDFTPTPPEWDDLHLMADPANNRLLLLRHDFSASPSLDNSVWTVIAVDPSTGALTTLDTYTAVTYATDELLYASNPTDQPAVGPDGAMWGFGQVGGSGSDRYIWRWTLAGGFQIGTYVNTKKYRALWPQRDGTLHASRTTTATGTLVDEAIEFATDLSETVLSCPDIPRPSGHAGATPDWGLSAFPSRTSPTLRLLWAIDLRGGWSAGLGSGGPGWTVSR